MDTSPHKFNRSPPPKMEFEAFQCYRGVNITYEVTYDEFTGQFMFMYANGERVEFSFYRYITHDGILQAEYDPETCTDREQWHDENERMIIIRWKDESQRMRMRHLVEYQEWNIRVKDLKANYDEYGRNLEKAQKKLNQIKCALHDRSALFILCLPACVERIKKDNWLPVELFQLLASYL